MSGIDIFIAILSAIMLLGGLYFNFKSRALTEEYKESHKQELFTSKKPLKK